jgi:hypothetical protein
MRLVHEQKRGRRMRSRSFAGAVAKVTLLLPLSLGSVAATAHARSLSQGEVDRLLLGCPNIPRGPITGQLEVQLRKDELAKCKDFRETVTACMLLARNPDVYQKCLRENYVGP